MLSSNQVLIVEDERAIAEDLRDILEDNGYQVVGIAHSYAKAVHLLKQNKVDIAILDIALKDNGSGIDVANHINNNYHIPFIFLTSFADNITIQEVVMTKPAAYLVKPFSELDIPPALALAQAASSNPDPDSFPPISLINEALHIHVTAQEHAILKLIWEGKSNSQIADQLYISVNTVKTHVMRLYKKLKVKTRVQAVTKVMSLV